MAKKPGRTGKKEDAAIEDVTWLNEVREVRHPLDITHPLLVRRVRMQTGPPLPRPSVPFPRSIPTAN